MEGVSIERFAKEAAKAATAVPGAEVVSIGMGCKNGKWYFGLFLKKDGAEIRYMIPELEADNGKDSGLC